jgi:DNA-binding MarR family transcriptional regulator
MEKADSDPLGVPWRPAVSTQSEALPLDDHLCFAMYSANIAINRLYRPMLDELGITYPQYLVLGALWENDGRTVGEIAERLSLESSTITPLVKRLETAGLVGRHRNQVDERQVNVNLTNEGKALRLRSKCLTEKLLDRSGLPVADMVRLNKEVLALRHALTARLDDRARQGCGS